MDTYHTPVLVDEVLEGLAIAPGKRYIDATLGGGGHGIEIVKRGGILLGIDTDPDAIEYTKEIFNFQFSVFKQRETMWTLVQGNFRDIETIAKKNGFEQVHGILFDLGVSSHQLDEKERGFSYRFDDAPLDMRLAKVGETQASDLLKRLAETELFELFATYGEEARARRVARAIVEARAVTPIQTSGQLVAIIKKIAHNQKERQGILSRIYQALRIAVNDEMGALRSGLGGASTLLVPGGRLAVISFHSLEDRIVKQFFKTDGWRLINKHPVVADEAEREINGRSRSAKLRIAQKQ